jgi:hypothetical protein
LATAAGFLLMLFALANSFVTLASQDYRGALLTALGCTLLALGCLAVPFVRGPLGWRAVAVLLASPALFVFADFARRAPYAFGGG